LCSRRWCCRCARGGAAAAAGRGRAIVQLSLRLLVVVAPMVPLLMVAPVVHQIP